MADTVPVEATLAPTANSQPEQRPPSPTVETASTAESAEKLAKTEKIAAPNAETDRSADTASAPLTSGAADAGASSRADAATDSPAAANAAPAATAAATAVAAPVQEGTKVASEQVRDTSTTTPAPTKAEAGASVDNQRDTTDSAMADAAKEDKAPAAAAAAAASPEASKPVDDAKKAADGDKETDGKGAADAETTPAAAETRAADADAAADKKDGDDDAPVAAAAVDDEKKSGGDDKAASSTPAKPAKTPTSLARRKSVGQKLNRKGSKARIVHLDAKPGDHYFVKLKGYPAWPVIICDEDMLPQTLIKSRPVTAARPDGTYREDYADGGKRASDRTFPVMYLFTNEFGWVPNQDLHDLDPEKVLDAINDKMRKDLQKAHQLAAESNPLSYYKDLLRQFQEDLEQAEEEKRQAEEAKRQALATPKKSKKASKEEDVDMLDVPADDDEPAPSTQKKSKKRKAEEDARTPQRTDSVKKPKIKITSSGTPKSGSASNGTPSGSKSAKAADAKSKSKTKGEPKAAKETSVPSEPELDPEEKRRRKSKEVLFLRHKIQKGLLTRDQTPKEEEMKVVSDYLTKLEGFPDLEVGVIRETKINKVLKAILKIATIPREEEFKFKPRSQVLLEKWNKLLAAEPATAEAASESAAANGTTTNGNTEAKEAKETKEEAKSNGVKKEAEKASEGKKETKEKASPEPAAESDKPKEEPAAVEATA